MKRAGVPAHRRTRSRTITADTAADSATDIVAPDITQDDLPDEVTFASLGVRPETLEALHGMNIFTPFAIQALSLPIALRGSDIIGQARTGTGKTLAFGIPLLERVEVGIKDAGGAPLPPQALVVVPTRELCIQVASDLERAGAARGVKVLAIYGGRSYEPQNDALKKGVEVVVGTPGRLLDLAQQGTLQLLGIRMLVLDEADEMLDLGFLPDVERILARTVAEGRQTMLFSATMPGPVVTLARRFLVQPTHVRAEMPDESRTVPTTSQHVFRAHAMDKLEIVARIMQAEGRQLAMIFCRTKRTCQKVSDDLAERGFAAGAVHGDLGQGQREQALRAFRAGKIDILVATDVAARGIDVESVTHVINYQCPDEEKTYLHRIGPHRPGRSDRHRGDVRRLGRAAQVGADQPRARPAVRRPARDLLHLAAPVRGLGHPGRDDGRLPRAQRTRAGLEAEVIEDLGETGRNARKPSADRVTSNRPTSGGSADRGPKQTDRPERSERSERPARAPRERTRTRGSGAAAAAAVGEPLFKPVATGSGEPAGGPTAAATAAIPSADATPAAAPAADGAPRRRRRRGGRGRGSGSGAPAAE